MNSLDFDLLLFRINKLFTENANKNLEEYNVTRTEMSFLLKLDEMKIMSQKELAESRNLNNATVTRALERLEKKGYVKKIEDMEDKRKKQVCLTPKGKENIDKILNKHEKFKKEIFYGFDKKEYETLLNLLNKTYLRLEDLKKE